LYVGRQSAVGSAPLAAIVLGEKYDAKKNAKKWRPLYGRLKILAQMVFEFKFAQGSGLALECVVEYALPAFEHQNEQVRKAAVDLFVESYMLEGPAADGYVATLKPALQTMIRAELASIDAPVAPAAPDRPATGLQAGTAARPGTASEKRPGTAQLIEQRDGTQTMPYADPVAKGDEAAAAYYGAQLGEEVARSLLNKSWQSRVAAFQKVEQQLRAYLPDEGDASESGPAGLADTAYRFVFQGIQDKVPHVYSASLVVLQVLASSAAQLTPTDAGADVLRNRIVRAIVAKLEDRNSRMRQRSEQALLELTRAPPPFGYEPVCRELMEAGLKRSSTPKKAPPSKDGVAPAPDAPKLQPTEGQLKLLTTMVQQVGLADGGPLELAKVAAHAIAALEDKDKKVRKVGIGVYVAAWRHVGTSGLAGFIGHLKPALRKILKNKTEGKPATADAADSDGVEDGGIMFFNEESAAAAMPKATGDGCAGAGATEGSAGGGVALPYTANLPEELQEAVKPLAAAFGVETMQCFYAKQWAPREAALRRVEGILRNHEGDCDRRLLLYTVFMLENALADKVAQVFWAGLSLLRTVVGSFTLNLPPAEVQFSAEKLLPLVIARLGDSNTRTAQAVEQTCLYFSWRPNIGGAFVGRHILSQDHGKNVKSLGRKLTLLAQLITDFGVGSDGVSLVDAFALIRPTMEHRDVKVRKAANAAYVAAHQRVGGANGERMGEINKLIGEVKPALREVLTKAVMDAPHKASSGQRPTTPAAFIFDRPSTAAARVSKFMSADAPASEEHIASLTMEGARSTSPVEWAQGEENVAAIGQYQLDTASLGEAIEATAAVGADRESAEKELQQVVDAQLNELTGLSGSLSVLKELFGEDLLMQFRQPDTSEREEAIESMQEAIWSHGPMLATEELANNSFEACSHLVKHALGDKAMAVQSAGLDLLKAVVVTHSRRLGAFEMRLALGSLVGQILNLAADGAIRLRSKAEEAILFLAHHPKVGPGCVGRYLLESASSSSMQRRKDKGRALVLCRLKLLEDLMGELSASLQGGSPTAKVEWPMETVATFCAGCIGHHKSTAVQNKARQVVSLVCKNGAHPALVGTFARFISVFAGSLSFCLRSTGPGALQAVQRLIAAPPMAEQEGRERVAQRLTEAIEDAARSVDPDAPSPARVNKGAAEGEEMLGLPRAASAGLPVVAGGYDGGASENARRDLVSWPAPDPSSMLSFGEASLVLATR
jgi:hypothetical protein